ncbi:MAG: 4Fe-4S dicluster domain-containing protein [Dermatophilaceae bacterium]|nr:4Fe-4S binding protein [Intrasporangiaceae bacterium]
MPSLLVLNESHLLAAMAAGAHAVQILGCLRCHHDRPDIVLEAVALAEAALGHPRRIRFHNEGDLVTERQQLAALAALPATSPWGASPTVLDRLSTPVSHRERLATLLPLVPNGAPEVITGPRFARVALKDDACVSCGACTVACPTQALRFSGNGTTLSVSDMACIGCGACASACPTNAITLEPVIPAGEHAADERTLLVDTPVPCVRCAVPAVPGRLLAHARNVLVAAALDPDDPRLQLGVCADCRDVTLRTEPLRPAPGHASHAPSGSCGSSGGCGCGSADASSGCGSQGSRVGAAAAASNGPSEPVFLGGIMPAPNGPAGVPQTDRRSVLKAAGLAAVASAAIPAMAQPAAAQEAATVVPGRLGMVIDLDRCIGCHACTAACKAENNVPLGVFRDWVEEHVLGEYPQAFPFFLPKLCNHCDDPGCLRACPTGAIFKREDGIVSIDHDICISCRACNQACPYGAAFMDPVRGTSDKCNLCAHRVDEGLNPACVDVCPSQCRIFGDFDDPESAVSVAIREAPSQVLRPELGMGPNIHYLGLPGELNR